MPVNKPYKVTFVLDNWELVKEGQRLKIRGSPLNDSHTQITTPSLIRYDEEEKWAETQTCLYKLLKRREEVNGDRLEKSEASEQQERAGRSLESGSYGPGMVRKT